MAAKMIQNGSLTNIATYEFICNTKTELDALPKSEYNFGSIALVLHNTNNASDSGNIVIYIADANKNWLRWG